MRLRGQEASQEVQRGAPSKTKRAAAHACSPVGRRGVERRARRAGEGSATMADLGARRSSSKRSTCTRERERERKRERELAATPAHTTRSDTGRATVRRDRDPPPPNRLRAQAEAPTERVDGPQTRAVGAQSPSSDSRPAATTARPPPRAQGKISGTVEQWQQRPAAGRRTASRAVGRRGRRQSRDERGRRSENGALRARRRRRANEREGFDIFRCVRACGQPRQQPRARRGGTAGGRGGGTCRRRRGRRSVSLTARQAMLPELQRADALGASRRFVRRSRRALRRRSRACGPGRRPRASLNGSGPACSGRGPSRPPRARAISHRSCARSAVRSARRARPQEQERERERERERGGGRSTHTSRR